MRERQGKMILNINCLLLDIILHKQKNHFKVESPTLKAKITGTQSFRQAHLGELRNVLLPEYS